MPLAPLRTIGHARSAPAATAVLLLALLSGSPAQAQASLPAAAKAGPTKVQSPPPSTKPEWARLTAAQQAALKPLAPAWSGISEPQKRKWIALSQNYPNLSAAEQATLHGRMSEWAGLSAAQRNQARLNFAQTKSLSTEEKKAQWQAYQALSPEQKKQLAAGAQSKAAGAAPAVTPIAPNKLAAVPVTRSEAGSPAAAASRPQLGHADMVVPKTGASAPVPAARL